MKKRKVPEIVVGCFHASILTWTSMYLLVGVALSLEVRFAARSITWPSFLTGVVLGVIFGAIIMLNQIATTAGVRYSFLCKHRLVENPAASETVALRLAVVQRLRRRETRCALALGAGFSSAVSFFGSSMSSGPNPRLHQLGHVYDLGGLLLMVGLLIALVVHMFWPRWGWQEPCDTPPV